MTSESLNVKTIALRYISTEDRLTVQLNLNDSSSRKLWITRHLSRSLIDALGNLLDKSYQEVPLIGSEQKIDKKLGLQFEQEEATEVKSQTADKTATDDTSATVTQRRLTRCAQNPRAMKMGMTKMSAFWSRAAVRSPCKIALTAR